MVNVIGVPGKAEGLVVAETEATSSGLREA